MKRRGEVIAIAASLTLGFLMTQLWRSANDSERQIDPLEDALWVDPPADVARGALDFSESDRAPAKLGPTPAIQGECLTSIADVVERTLPSVVNISSTRAARDPRFGSSETILRKFFRELPLDGVERVPSRKETSLGSAVIVSKDGVLLTNNHVVENAEAVEVTLSDGRALYADIVGTDPESDLAVLKIQDSPKDLVPIPFGDSSALRLGDPVIAIGNPFGVGQTVTMGIISAKGRADLGIVDYEDFIQTDAAINPGSSGGALVSIDGRLIGINTAILSRTGGYQGIGFAIPADMARPIMLELIREGKVSRGWLGVAIQELTPTLSKALGLRASRGVMIADVGKGSPADRAGLRPHDVVLAVDGNHVHTAGTLRNQIARRSAGSRVEIHVLRGGRPLRVKAVLRARPPSEDELPMIGRLPQFDPAKEG
jgi:serine protease Do